MNASPPQQENNVHDTLEIALVGNPNTGKSTLFNRLTGIHQRTGNYPGVTVEKKIGNAKVGTQTVTVIDLPGTYSLDATSADERVVIDVLNGRIPGTRQPDVVVCVVDATNLMRNLFLASQIAETHLPMVVALNMSDVAAKQGIVIDDDLLADRLEVPVVTICAATNEGVDELRDMIDMALVDHPRMAPIDWPGPIADALALIHTSIIETTGIVPNDAEVQRLLFDENSAIAERLDWPEQSHEQTIAQAKLLLKEAKFNSSSAEAIERYGHLGELMEGVITHPTERRISKTESIDRVLTHKFWGLFIFAGLMWLVFSSIYSWAGPIMDMIEGGFNGLGELVGGWFEGSPILQSLVVDGIVAGVGGVVIFLPQILILFFFVSLLEDTGYMARAAFLMDRLFRWSGLNGRSFVPMLSSYACAIPGIMAARTIEDPKARLTTILISPLMSCSARLPVYVLFIGAFVEPVYGVGWATFCLFFMHIIGLIVALPIAFVINRLILKTKPRFFIMEMPRYHVPHVRDVLMRMWLRGLDFLKTAGTIIFAMSIIVWALCYFPRSDNVGTQAEQKYVSQIALEKNMPEAQLQQFLETPDGKSFATERDNLIAAAYIEQSYMGRFGQFVQPVFAPAGFDWKITVGVLASFPAREVIISTLGIIYNLGSDVDEDSPELKETIKTEKWPDGRPIFTIPVAFAIMVFFALCMQCGATLATIVRETNWQWAVFSFVYMTMLAWVGAVVTYQVGSLFVG